MFSDYNSNIFSKMLQKTSVPLIKPQTSRRPPIRLKKPKITGNGASTNANVRKIMRASIVEKKMFRSKIKESDD